MYACRNCIFNATTPLSDFYLPAERVQYYVQVFFLLNVCTHIHFEVSGIVTFFHVHAIFERHLSGQVVM